MIGRMPDFRLSAADHLNAARFWVEKAEAAMNHELTMGYSDYHNTIPVEPDPAAAMAFASLAELHIQLSDRTEDETA